MSFFCGKKKLKLTLHTGDHYLDSNTDTKTIRNEQKMKKEKEKEKKKKKILVGGRSTFIYIFF